MSVVNQMLRDLDRRQTGDQAVYAQHIEPSASSRRKPLIVIALVFVLALTMSYGVLRYIDQTETREAPAQAPVLKVTTANQTKAPAVEAAPQIATSASAAPAVEEESAPDIESTLPDPVVEAVAQPPVATEAVTNAVAVTDTPTVIPVVAQPSASRASEPVDALEAVVPAEVVRDPGPTRIDVRPYAPKPTADGEYRRAAALINQGRSQEARAALQQALELDPAHEAARQTLAVLLIEANANGEAEALLAEGLRLNPTQTNFAIVLARLQLDRGDDAGALQVLRAHASAAQSNAEYRAFTAALLHRLDRHMEAIEEYRAVLQLSPRAGIWWVGLARSYEAAGQTAAAADAYANARDSGTLTAGVAQFVEQKLQTLR